MISVIFQIDGQIDGSRKAIQDQTTEAIARSFAPLVSGAMEGIVREVIIWSPHAAPTEDLQLLCDGSGAYLIEHKSCKEMLRCTRSDWLLLLEPGAILWGDWHGGVLHHINNMKQAGHFQLSSEASHLPWWRRLLRKGVKNSALKRGCLIAKPMALAANKTSIQSIANGRAFKVINGGTILPPRPTTSE